MDDCLHARLVLSPSCCCCLLRIRELPLLLLRLVRGAGELEVERGAHAASELRLLEQLCVRVRDAPAAPQLVVQCGLTCD